MEPSSSRPWHDLLQGGVSAVTSTVATNPFLHWQFCKVEKVPFHMRDIWRGMSANFTSYLGFMTVAHVTKGMLRSGLDRWHWKHTERTELVIGSVSGAMSVFAVCPGECIATKDNNTGAGNLKIFLKTIRNEGVFGLYRGFIPTLVRDSIAVGGVLTWGTLLQKKISLYGVDSRLATISSSLLVGFGTVVATQPAQVLRIRLQVDRSATIKGFFNDLKGKPKLRILYAGTMPRTAINVVLVAVGILIDDNLDRLLK